MRLFLAVLLGLPVVSVAAEKITLSGSSTVAPLILELAKIYEKENSNIRVNVQTGGSSRGVADARKGLSDIGMASRGLKGTEKDLTAHTVAVDGVAPIVHSSNLVSNLTTAQMRDIFLGKITNWKQVGGNDLDIVVVNRAEGRSELEMVAKKLGIKSIDIKAHLIAGENAHALKSVAGNRRSISYMSLGHAVREAELGVPIRLVSFNGVPATIANVSSGQFPLSRPLNLLTKGMPSGSAEKFLQFVQSSRAHNVIEEQSFVPITR